MELKNNYVKAWFKSVTMAVKRTVRGFTMLTCAVNLPRERVVGRDVEYKYRVATPSGKYWEELSVVGESGHMNRLLQGKPFSRLWGYCYK